MKAIALTDNPPKRLFSTAFKDKCVHAVFFINGMLVVLLLGGIFLLLIQTSIPAFQEVSIVEFLTSTNWNPTSYVKASYGIIPMLVSTFMVTVGALAIAIPIGIGAAAYLSDVASPRVREILKPTIEMLAAVPSVVIGFLGIVFVGPLIAKFFNIYNGLNAINGSVLLAVMALPTIISISEDALSSVPYSYDQASLALGATKWQTVIRVKIPAALSGIIAACMLGMGRAIGETMTVLMATGCAPAMPEGFPFEAFLGSVRTLTSSIAIELGEVAYNTTHYYALFALGLVLFVITFVINLISDIILHNFEKVHR